MPTLKHHFRYGKMNKDLDERLVANGEYRDALNVQVSSSEGSDVGSLQNVLGNKKPYSSDVGVIGATCVGSIRDSQNEKIYWFIAGTSVSAIVEYNQQNNTHNPVLVDANSILNFSENNLITGINIIDGLLFWTDDQTEPKVINIEKFKQGSTDYLTHTELISVATGVSYQFTEEDVTVIKKSPLKAPSIDISNTKRVTAQGTPGILNTTVTGNFYDEDEEGSVLEGTVVSTIITGQAPTYIVGDYVILNTGDDDDINGFEPDFSIRAQVISLSGTSMQVEVLSAPDLVPSGTQVWDVELEQDDPMFENKFIRFAYRYKYKDGEFSSIGPFSEIAFIPKDDFDYDPSKGYNLAMQNDCRYLRIYNFVPSDIPKQVKEVEIVYKDENSPALYTVKSFKPSDPEWLSNGSFEVESEVVYKVIPSNQLLRPWDNVPRKAKAQEMSANRLIYANYLQQFDMKDDRGRDVTPNFSLSVINNSDYNDYVPKNPGKSIKSMRTYQMGVVYKDEYGRETPVFTDTTGSKRINKASAVNYNKLQVKLNNEPPNFATDFKFFIKETSNQYYNLAMDRWYDAQDGNVWISFSSSERNKVDEETFLILKKRHASDDFVDALAKYKIIAIENEAPLYLKEQKVSYGIADYSPGNVTGTTARPIEGGYNFKITEAQLIDDSLISENVLSDSGLVLRFKKDLYITDWYPIASISVTGQSNKIYEFTVAEKFGSDVEPFSTGDMQLEIARIEVKNKAEFAGRFFVKLNRDGILEENILNTIEQEYGIKEIALMQRKTSVLSGSGWRDWHPHKRGWVTENSQGVATLNHRSGNRDLWFGNRGRSVGDGIYPGNRIITFAYLWYGAGDSWSSGSAFDNRDFALGILKIGAKFRFREDPDQIVYTVKDSLLTEGRNYSTSSRKRGWGSNKRFIFHLKLDKEIQGFSEADYPESWINAGIDRAEFPFHMELLQVDAGDNTFSTDNPAIWETEPKEDIGLDIYYEATDAFPISEHGDVKQLDWFNCYSFKNGVESNRLRDDFNKVQISKGVKASSTLDQEYKEERKGAGLIFSGIFNSTSGINRLNQFIQAEPITKDLNPAYGTIQKLYSKPTRDGDLIAFCEDKVFNILANKDALFNADGNANITSNNAVLGQALPYTGEFGISKNPESFATYGFRSYFTDKARGAVLRLSRNGIEPISKDGMFDFFRDKLASCSLMIGSYDENKDQYNLTLTNLNETGVEDTVSYSESVKGWTSRYSFLKESGLSLNNIYYTFKNGELYSHNNETRNNFYGNQYNTEVSLLINDIPGSIKSYQTLNYEGTKSYIKSDITDDQFYNDQDQPGWWCSSISTDLQEGHVDHFLDKEGKKFQYIMGKATTLSNLDTKEFSVQGIGSFTSISGDTQISKAIITVTENND
jgi:hypothetical protein